MYPRPSALLPILFLLLLTACAGDDDEDTPPPDPAAIVLTSDWITGGVALVDDAGTVSPGPGLIHSDAVVRQHEGLLYVVNRRGADNIQVLDPEQGYRTVANFSTGAGTNPQDIAFGPDGRAYIALYETDYLAVVDPADGTELERIDIPEQYVDSDGLPEASSLVAFGSQLLVIVQRLDRAQGYRAANDSYLVRFDLTTGEKIDDLKLAFPNPFGIMHPNAEGRFLLAEAGDFIDAVGADPALWQDGGLELIDGPGFTSLGVVAREAELGGDVVFAALDGERVFAVVGRSTESGTSTDVFRIDVDPVSGAVTPVALFTPGAWVVGDLQVDGSSTVWVSDRTTNAPGVYLFAADGSKRFLPFGEGLLPPGQILFLR